MGSPNSIGRCIGRKRMTTALCFIYLISSSYAIHRPPSPTSNYTNSDPLNFMAMFNEMRGFVDGSDASSVRSFSSGSDSAQGGTRGLLPPLNVSASSAVSVCEHELGVSQNVDYRMHGGSNSGISGETSDMENFNENYYDDSRQNDIEAQLGNRDFRENVKYGVGKVGAVKFGEEVAHQQSCIRKHRCCSILTPVAMIAALTLVAAVAYSKQPDDDPVSERIVQSLVAGTIPSFMAGASTGVLYCAYRKLMKHCRKANLTEDAPLPHAGSMTTQY